MKIRIGAFEKNSAQQEEVKSELEGQISKLEKILKEKDTQICASRTVIEENRLINSEYSAQGKMLGRPSDFFLSIFLIN